MQLDDPRLLNLHALFSKVPLAHEAKVQMPNHPDLDGIDVLVYCQVNLWPKMGKTLSDFEKPLDEGGKGLSDVVYGLLRGVSLVLHQDGNDIGGVDLP